MEYFYGAMHRHSMTKIFKLQKRALRIISNSSYLSHTKPLFEKYNTLNIFQIYSKEVAIFMCKYRNGLLPLSFDDVFSELVSNHEYNTRNKTNFRHEMHKMKTVFTSGPKTWNKLPEYVKKAINLNSFKKLFLHFWKLNDTMLSWFL